MSYICSCNSEKKLFHWYKCKYVKMIPKKNRIEIKTAKEARDQGYKYCKYCAAIMEMLREEGPAVEQYGNRHGIYLSFDRNDGSIDVVSRVGKWKLVYNSRRKNAFLYHKNNAMNHDPKDLIKGYHYQSAYSETLLGYLEYIYEHDTYRMTAPSYFPQNKAVPYGNGSKKRKKKAKNKQRKQSIRYVNYLLDGLAAGSLVL